MFVRSYLRSAALRYKWTVRRLIEFNVHFWLLLAQGDIHFEAYVALAIKLGILTQILVASGVLPKWLASQSGA